MRRDELAIREKPNIEARLRGSPIPSPTRIWISDVISDPPDVTPSYLWGRLEDGGGYVVLLDRNDEWILCEPLGEAEAVRARHAQEVVRRARDANVQEPPQTTAVESVAVSLPETVPAASPSAETDVMPPTQESDLSIVRCCSGHGMHRQVFPEYQIIICPTCNTRFEVPETVS